jgi:hypothetical protein
MGKDRAKEPKMTPTSRHILGTPPDEAVDLPPPDVTAVPPGRRPVPRLSLGATPQVPYEPEKLAAFITHPAWNPTVFCDANCFIARTDLAVWNALLTRRLALTPSVIGELSSWLASPTNNGFVRDIVARMLNHEPGTPFEVTQFDGDDPIAMTSIEYYGNLLGIRKRLFDILESQFELANGRKPSPPELESLAKKQVGERGYQRAKKGREGKGAKHPFADEELVVFAFFYAICFGEEVLILTRDADVQEQFYKMQWLLDTHYRSLLLADRYAEDPAAFRTVPMPKDDERVREVFVGEDDLLIERDGGTPHDVLPNDYQPVNLYCWLLKGEGEHATLTQTTFCAEREMMKVFRAKGVTAGLNTDSLGDRNMHIWLSPLPIQPCGGWAAVATDARVEVRSARIPLLDIQHAMNTDERFRHVRMAGEAVADGEGAEAE